MKKLKSNKGITLVALVITIIVLLILAIVSIRLVMNEGIINKAETATEEYSHEEFDEQRKLVEAEVEMDKYSSSVKTELTEEEATAAGWVWNSNGALTGYTGTATELYIPSKIGDMEITVLNHPSFNDIDKGTITKVVVPGTIKNISGSYFAGFSNLETVILNEGTTKITSYAFQNCYKLEKLVLPSTVTEISIYGLANTGIKEIVIPKTVTTVGMGIFGWCYGGPITVYCEAESKPEGWDDAWFNYVPEGSTVEWGYKG